ncbi:MAG: hypothetical protein KF693_08095 [Nitrospira sp.]|nr:hypothetical protein [Nitrospira sp.]
MENAPSQRKEPTKVEPTVSAFADESVTPEIIVCAAAIFPIEQVAMAVARLASMKEDLGLSPTAALHCRVIFNGNERRRSDWRNISPQSITSAIMALCQDLSVMGHRPVAFVSPPLSIVIPPPPNDKSKAVSLDDKGQVATGYQVLSFHLTKVYGHGGAKLWIDPDPTKIPWLNGRTQANFTRSGFMDLGPEFEPPRSEPIIDSRSKHPLLEIADLYAYVTAKAHTAKGGWKDRWFQEVYSVLKPGRLLWQATNPDIKWEKG